MIDIDKINLRDHESPDELMYEDEPNYPNDTALLEACREALKRSNSTDNTLFERLDERLAGPFL